MLEALILINAPPKGSGQVVEALRQLPQVREAGAVYGDIDVYALVSVAGLEELDRLIMEGIQAIDTVRSTKTYLVIGNLFWRR